MSDEHLYENVYYSRKRSNMEQQHKPELLQNTQKQADEIVEIMYENVTKVMDRGEKLDDLNIAATELVNQASVFKDCSEEVKRKHWWAHMKSKIIIGIILAIILIIVITTLVSAFK